MKRCKEICEQCKIYQEWQNAVEYSFQFKWTSEKGIEVWSRDNYCWFQVFSCMLEFKKLTEKCPFILEHMMMERKQDEFDAG